MGTPASLPPHRPKPRGAKTMMVEPCWNQPISSPLLKLCGRESRAARGNAGAATRRENGVNARHQDRRHRHQRNRVSTVVEGGAQHCALVAAEQPPHSSQRDRVDVPGVDAQVGEVFDLRRPPRRRRPRWRRRGWSAPPVQGRSAARLRPTRACSTRAGSQMISDARHSGRGR